MATKNSLSTFASIFSRSVAFGVYASQCSAPIEKRLEKNKAEGRRADHGMDLPALSCCARIAFGIAHGAVGGLILSFFEPVREKVADYLNTREGLHPMSVQADKQRWAERNAQAQTHEGPQFDS